MRPVEPCLRPLPYDAPMIVCRVIGQAVATVKSESLRASSLMLVARTDASGAGAGEPFVAVDTVGAGDGELVLVAQGSSAREAIRTPGPIDAAIIAIVDSLTVGGKRTYSR
jgi:microcompartment protein CcmK/EutM